MATTTTRLLLRKPDPHPTTGDFISVVTDINESMDKLDATIGFTVCTSGTRPTGADRWQGRNIFETDTAKAYMWDGSAWIQIALGTSAYISTSTIEATNFLISGAPDRDVAAELTALAVPRITFVKKAANETVNNSITQQNDDHLVLAVAANTTYVVEVHALINCFANAGIDSSFTYPASAELTGYVNGPANDASGVGSSNGWWYTVYNQTLLTDTTSPSGDLFSGGLSAGTAWDVQHVFKGHLKTGANAGNLQWRFAQNAAVANNLTVYAGSWMEIRKVNG